MKKIKNVKSKVLLIVFILFCFHESFSQISYDTLINGLLFNIEVAKNNSKVRLSVSNKTDSILLIGDYLFWDKSINLVDEIADTYNIGKYSYTIIFKTRIKKLEKYTAKEYIIKINKNLRDTFTIRLLVAKNKQGKFITNNQSTNVYFTSGVKYEFIFKNNKLIVLSSNLF